MAEETVLPDTTIETDTHSHSVQSNPPLIISKDKITGEEVHSTGEEAMSLWEQIKAFFKSEEGAALAEEVEDDYIEEEKEPEEAPIE